MKRLLMVGAAALAMSSLLVAEASAQRGFRGGGVFVGGARPMAVRGGWVGGPRVGIGRGAWVGPGWGGGWGRPGWGWGRPGWGWGAPVAAGIIAGAAWGGGWGGGWGGDPCLRWNGWQWVNVCWARPAYGW